MEKENCTIHAAILKIFGRKKKSEIDGFSYILSSQYDAIEAYIKNEATKQEFLAIQQNFEGVDHRYLVIKNENQAILVAYFQLFTLTYKNFNTLKTNAFLKKIITYFLQFKKVKVLFLGNVLRTNQAAYFYDEKVLEPNEAISLLSTSVEKIAKEENISASILREIPTNDVDLLTEMGYSSPFKDVMMEMELEPKWQTFADYQSDLSRKYAARSKKIRKSLENLQKNQLTEQEIKLHSPQISNLFNQVVEKQAFVLGKVNADYFISLKSIYKENFEF